MQIDGEEDDGQGLVTDFSGDTDLDALFDDGPSDNLGVDELGSGTESPRTPAPAPVQQPAQAGQQQPTPAPASGQPPVAPAAPTSQAPVQPQGQPGPQQQASQPVDFETYVAQNADALIQRYAETAFALSPAEKEAMGAAAAVAPQYMAKAHLYTMVATARAVREMLPTVVGSLVETFQQSSTLTQEFQASYPELKNVDRGQLVTLGRSLRQANPNIPPAEFIPLFARTAAAFFGVQLAPAQQQGRQPAQGQRRTQAFVPAGATSPRGAAPTPGRRVVANGADQLFSINEFLRND